MVRVSEDGKPALTFFREMEQYPGARLMQATLGTGRTHQIRVHAAHIGHPLAGDPKYGDREMNKRFREMGLQRLFLHAAHLSFELDGRLYSFSAPLPDDLKDFLDVLAVKGNADVFRLPGVSIVGSRNASIEKGSRSLTTVMRGDACTTSPSAASRPSASRSGVRLTPRRTDCSTSASTVPGRRTPDWISSRRLR